jgi:putative Mg2+ transporter-C (MgtC) family protein
VSSYCMSFYFTISCVILQILANIAVHIEYTKRKMVEIFMNEQAELALRLLLSFVVGILLGLEREQRQKPAGLRTHALVCLGASLFTIAGITGFPQDQGATLVRNIDPARVAAQIVTGVGFIGGGIIFKEHDHIRGITTAASIWLTAGIGMGLGAGLYLLSGVATLLGLIGLKLDKMLQKEGND